MDLDGASPTTEWSIVLAERGMPVAPQSPTPVPRTRWLALGIALLVGLTLLGTGVVVRHLVRPRAGVGDLRPGPVMGGPGASYAVTWLGAGGAPVRWNPCRPIRWVANLAGASPDAVDDVAAAFVRLSAASGLTFDYRGTTDEVPSVERPGVQARYGDDWAPLLVASAPLKGTPLGAGLGTGAETVGVATPLAITEPGKPTAIVSAQVVLEAGRPLVAGFGSSESRGSIVLHELAHALGLGHVPDPTQVMSSGGASGAGPGELQAGDLAGLAALGATGGCLDEPEPSVVDPT